MDDIGKLWKANLHDIERRKDTRNDFSVAFSAVCRRDRSRKRRTNKSSLIKICKFTSTDSINQFQGIISPFCLFVYYLDLSANLVQKCTMHYIFNSVSWESICVHNSHQLRMCDASAFKKTWGHQKAIVANDTSLGLLCLSLSHS